MGFQRVGGVSGTKPECMGNWKASKEAGEGFFLRPGGNSGRDHPSRVECTPRGGGAERGVENKFQGIFRPDLSLIPRGVAGLKKKDWAGVMQETTAGKIYPPTKTFVGLLQQKDNYEEKILRSRCVSKRDLVKLAKNVSGRVGVAHQP